METKQKRSSSSVRHHLLGFDAAGEGDAFRYVERLRAFALLRHVGP